MAGNLVYIVLLSGSFYLFRRYFVAAAYGAMTSSPTALLLFGSLPCSYYIFDYATTIYSDALYSGIQALNEFLPTVLVVFYVLFLPAFHVQSQKRSSAEMQRSLLEVELKQSQQEMDSLRQSEMQTAVYQHDMRHHLNMISGLLASGSPQQAQEYIQKVQSDVEAITSRRFCENETVNLLCSSFVQKAEKSGVTLNVDARVPAHLPISDTELCSLLSNALENALRAASTLRPEFRRTVDLYCGIRLNKLLIEVRNPYDTPPVMRDGVPVSDAAGHGFGCRSIQAIAQQRGGLCPVPGGAGHIPAARGAAGKGRRQVNLRASKKGPAPRGAGPFLLVCSTLDDLLEVQGVHAGAVQHSHHHGVAVLVDEGAGIGDAAHLDLHGAAVLAEGVGALGLLLILSQHHLTLVHEDELVHVVELAHDLLGLIRGHLHAVDIAADEGPVGTATSGAGIN